LYLGSGIGLVILMGIRYLRGDSTTRHAYLSRKDLPWFAGAALSGGVVGPALPASADALSATAVGFFGYGVSLVLFVLALLILQESPNVLFIAGFAAMALGLWLHLTETPEIHHRHGHK
jgi:EamA domain-containing membrane protein RarD